MVCIVLLLRSLTTLLKNLVLELRIWDHFPILFVALDNATRINTSIVLVIEVHSLGYYTTRRKQGLNALLGAH